MRADLIAAPPLPDPSRLYVWKQARCGFEMCTQCVPGREWWITETPSGRIIAKCRTWAEAIETAADYLRAALGPEACS